MSVQAAWQLVGDAAKKWWTDNGMRLGASVAFYAMLSLAPLLVIITAVAGLVFGPDAAEGRLTDEMAGLVGPAGAEVVRTLLASSYLESGSGVLATVLGVLMLLFGATGVFAELQDALNMIWQVPPQKRSGVLVMIRDRFLSFGMVLGIAFLLLVSLVISAVLSGLSRWAGGLGVNWAVFQAIHFVVSLGLITLLFALIFKMLPAAPIGWRDVWVGATVTGLLFTVGKWLIGLYLANAGLGTTYGAAGSLAVFLVWVYYSALILFFGAELTHVYAHRFGSRAKGRRVEAAQPETVRADGERVTV